MKLKFKNQEFQTGAVNVVADLFLGQEQLHSSFTIEMESANSMLETDYGIGNKLVVDAKTVAENMHAVQRRQGLPLTEVFSDELLVVSSEPKTKNQQLTTKTAPQFSIEMETGTGKTYVYTKTAFELNKRYGFTKFIIVVPSVAIREGIILPRL
ncbi:MAG: DEAD/DEAH box helicase family protein [Rikenellaceae bacterium]